jgi:hypothetical protein
VIFDFSSVLFDISKSGRITVNPYVEYALTLLRKKEITVGIICNKDTNVGKTILNEHNIPFHFIEENKHGIKKLLLKHRIRNNHCICIANNPAVLADAFSNDIWIYGTHTHSPCNKLLLVNLKFINELLTQDKELPQKAYSGFFIRENEYNSYHFGTYDASTDAKGDTVRSKLLSFKKMNILLLKLGVNSSEHTTHSIIPLPTLLFALSGITN